MTRTRLFHYTHREDIAKRIAREGLLRPGIVEPPSGMGWSERYCEPRVNLTSVPPEHGVERIKQETGLVVKPEYALELIVDADRYRISQPFFEQFPNTYSVFSEDPIEVVVKNIWNVERNHRRANAGRSMKRYGAEVNYFSHAM